MTINLFRCSPEYVRSLISRADCAGIQRPLKALYVAKLAEDDVLMVDAVDALFRELVLEGGLG